MWQSAHNRPWMFHSAWGLYLCLSFALQLVQYKTSFFPNRCNVLMENNSTQRH
jgi:hypothetical protein